MAKKSAPPVEVPAGPSAEELAAAADAERAAQVEISRKQTEFARSIRLQKLARKNPELTALIAERDALLVENADLKAALPPVAPQ